jgi:hypothetical protein
LTDVVEPAGATGSTSGASAISTTVDREAVIGQFRRGAPLASGHCERREKSRVTQRIAILKSHHRVVERCAAIEHPGARLVAETCRAIAACDRNRHFVLASVKANGIANPAVKGAKGPSMGSVAASGDATFVGAVRRWRRPARLARFPG